jgi:hypothetical protein
MWEDTDCTDPGAIGEAAKAMAVPNPPWEDTRDVGKRASVMECASPLALFPINQSPAGFVPEETLSGLRSRTRISRIGFRRRIPDALA